MSDGNLGEGLSERAKFALLWPVMRTRNLVFLAALCSFPVWAQVQISVQLPTVTFGVPPPLVVVQPGIQVVPDYDEEVFFVDNYYWVRRGPQWYRARDHRGGWVVVEAPRVPRPLVALRPGHYRHYRHADGPGPGRVKMKHHRGHGHGRD